MATSASSVLEARVGELAQLSATLADAFGTEPITQWLDSEPAAKGHAPAAAVRD